MPCAGSDFEQSLLGTTSPLSSNRHGWKFEIGVVVLALVAALIFKAGQGTALTLPGGVCCVVATVAVSIAPLPRIVRWFKRSIAEQPELELPFEKKTVGWFGVLMFAHGVFDMCMDVLFCLNIFQCDKVLCFCATVSLLGTFGVSWYLGGTALRAVFRDSPDANQWVFGHGGLVTAIVLASGSRVESLAVLRLRLDRPFRLRIAMPMEDSHFHFLRHAGMYHHLIEDLPHMLIGIVMLIAYDGADKCADHHESFLASKLPFDSWEWIIFNTVHSSLSIAWGIASRAVQLLALDAMAAREVTLSDVLLGGGSMRQSRASRAIDLGDDAGDAAEGGFTVGGRLDAKAGAEGTASFTMGIQQQRPPPAVVALMRHSLRLDTEDPSADWPVRSLSPSRDCPTCPAWCVFERAGILIWNRHTSWAFHTHGLA